QPDARHRPLPAGVRAQQRAVPRGRARVAARVLVQRRKRRDRKAAVAVPPPAVPAMSDQRHHVAALDAVRGLAIAAMILVNNPGDWNSVFAPLQHSEWNGWTFADVVFPFFVFIMGCAMPFAFARRQARHGDDWRAGMRVLRRAVLLIALGLVLNLEIAAPHVSALRIPGVLQRLALAYLGAALIVRSTRPLRQAAIAGVLLLGYWALLTLVPFGGMPPPADLTHDRNLAGFIDAA